MKNVLALPGGYLDRGFMSVGILVNRSAGYDGALGVERCLSPKIKFPAYKRKLSSDLYSFYRVDPFPS